MTEVINPWGPLGYPTKEEIQRWWDLPYGQFTQLRKEKSKKLRGKPPITFTLCVIKEVSSLYSAEIQVVAKDYQSAIKELGYDYSKFEFEKEPFKTGKVSYSVRLAIPK